MIGLGLGFSPPGKGSLPIPTDPPVNLSLPVVSGTPQVGQTLTATRGTWSNSPTGYTRQWYADEVEIEGATGSSLLLIEDYVDAEITHGVVATNIVGDSEEAISDPVGPVEELPPEPVLPGAIDDLTATAQSDTEVLLEWTPAEAATSHQYRIDGGEPVACDDNSGVQLVDGLDPETEYAFEVRGVNAEGAGEWSNTALAETEAAEPPGPVPLTRLAAEVDSITYFETISYARQWAGLHGDVDVDIWAVTGNGIADGEARLPTVIASDPSHLTILTGANDMTSFPSPEDYVAAVLDYVAEAKALKPSLVVGVCGQLPQGPEWWAFEGFNEGRAVFNAAMRAAVGDEIDFYVPLGDHPLLDDAAGSNLDYFGDGVHPSAAVQTTMMLPVYSAVMDSILAEATGTVPNAFALADTGAAPSTDCFADTGPISGLGMGETATVTIGGDGAFRVGHGAFGTSPRQVMNGDIVTVKVTSSSSPETAVSATLTIGGVSDTFTVTTGGSSSLEAEWVDLYTAGTADSYTTNKTIADVAYAAGPQVLAIATRGTSLPSAVSLDGVSATQLGSGTATGQWMLSFWLADMPGAGTADLEITQPFISWVGVMHWALSGAAAFAGEQVLAQTTLGGEGADVTTPSLDLPAGGVILFAVHSLSDTLDGPAAGCTIDGFAVAEGTSDSGTARYWAGQRASTGPCGVHVTDWNTLQIVAIALEPA